MSSVESMTKFAEELVTTTTGKPLNFIQKVVLQETLTKSQKTYAQLAQENNYSEAYIRQWVAPQLWIQLSKALGEKVNKTNCSALLEQRLASAQTQNELTTRSNFSKMNILELPEGQLSLTSASEFELLTNITGGFPHLVQFSLYYSKRYRLPLGDILKDASTERGIFNRDLNYLLLRLQKDSRLLEGLQAALISPVELETEVAFKLKILGLIHLVQGKAYLSCELYQNYFVNYFRNSL